MKQFLISIRMTLILLLIVSGAYPLVVWGVGQALFPYQANGSLVTNSSGQVIGSSLLAQGFTHPEYFHPRPSAAGNGYDPTASGGANLGPTSDKLIHGAKGFNGVQQLVTQYRIENSLSKDTPVPVDAVTRSGSGLDPDISLLNAEMQAARIAKARGIGVSDVRQLIQVQTQGRTLGIWAEPRVNVLQINRTLDRRYPLHKL